MAVDLAEVDKNQQTPPFYAASRGNLGMVRCPLRLGFEANSADDINEIARMLIESRLPAGDAPDHTKTESTGLPRPFVTWCFCAIFQRVVR